MWADIENNIRTILDTIGLIGAVSARMVVNRNTGRADEADLRLYSVGKSNSAFENVDSRFYGIMATQKILKIPSVRQSTLLADLAFGDGAAVFFPLNSRFGYIGFVWACFPAEIFTDRVCDSFIGCCEWTELLLRNWLEGEFSEQAQADHYMDLMEKLKIPALIMILPDRTLVSNPSFEGMKEKEAFLNALRKDADNPEDNGKSLSEFDFILKKVDLAGGKSGRIYVFPHAGGDIRNVRFGENEIRYYHLLTQKALGTLALMDSSGELTNLQKNYVTRTVHPLQRLEALFEFSTKHYQRAENTATSFEVLSVTEIAREVIYDLAAAARNKRVEIELNTDSGNKGSSAGNAVGDPWLLTLAIYDLLDNAIRFSPMNGKPINIGIGYGENEWTLRVEDSGAGISPLDLERMQELNYAEAAVSGLHGIALVKYVAKVHNGKLSIDSRLGRGSIFTLTIPYF